MKTILQQKWFYAKMSGPVGELLIVSDKTHVRHISMHRQKYMPEIKAEWEENATAAPVAQALAQLHEYFQGRRKKFQLPLALEGTAFQKEVWAELMKIPWGSTISYGELARRINRPNASRAAGLANGRNPVAIVVPCHRVIGANGSLTGYGGGLARKQQLLSLESSDPDSHKNSLKLPIFS